MIELLMAGGKKGVPVDMDDVNADEALVSASAAMMPGQSRGGTLGGSSPTSTAAVAIGYWNGKIYVLKADGLHTFNVSDMAYSGMVPGVAGRTIPLNTASYLHKGVLYFGQGRTKTGVIESLNLETGVYKTYPSLPYDYGAIYVDDDYVYSIANVYKSTGFSSNAIRRCRIDGLAWEDVILSGAFSHGVSGGDATLMGGFVYITGGGSIKNTSEGDGSAYVDVLRVDLTNLQISTVQITSPGFTPYDMPSCVWKGVIYTVQQSSTVLNQFDILTGRKTTASVPTNQFHCPCLRVGDLFFWLSGYSSKTIYQYKLPGGL